MDNGVAEQLSNRSVVASSTMFLYCCTQKNGTRDAGNLLCRWEFVVALDEKHLAFRHGFSAAHCLCPAFDARSLGPQTINL